MSTSILYKSLLSFEARGPSSREAVGGRPRLAPPLYIYLFIVVMYNLIDFSLLIYNSLALLVKQNIFN